LLYIVQGMYSYQYNILIVKFYSVPCSTFICLTL
jgi:hypothetical protein